MRICETLIFRRLLSVLFADRQRGVGNARDAIEFLRVHLKGILHFRSIKGFQDPLAKLSAKKYLEKEGRHAGILPLFFFSFIYRASCISLFPALLLRNAFNATSFVPKISVSLYIDIVSLPCASTRQFIYRGIFCEIIKCTTSNKQLLIMHTPVN